MKVKTSRIPGYLQKLGVHHLYQVNPPDLDVDMVVVIPCYDEPAPERTVHSLANTFNPGRKVLVLFIHNFSQLEQDAVKQRIREKFGSVQSITTPDWLVVRHSLCGDLPVKEAGVGLARKIGMDAAADLLWQAGKPVAPIICLDADCTVAGNYFQALFSAFDKHQEMPAASIHFEHPVSGNDYPEDVYEAIVQYELHLRYFIEACRYTGHPYIYQTVGSSMAVRAEHYARQGGMNKRQAGEDFYFLHKFTHLNGFREINETCVFPSPRKSHRVPFGTGKAVNEILQSEKNTYETYCLQSFHTLKELFSIFPALYKADKLTIENSYQKMLFQTYKDPDNKTSPQHLEDFLPVHELVKQVQMAGNHAANEPAYLKRMWQWFNPFMMMKYLHFARDAGHKNEAVEMTAAKLLQLLGHAPTDGDARGLLAGYRKLGVGKVSEF